MSATWKIILINFAVFGLSYALISHGVYLNNLLALRPIWDDGFLTFQLITHFFAHSTPLHILSNMMMFAIFSPTVEKNFGKSEFWRFYLLSGLFSSGLYCIFSSDSIIGASGCVFAVMGSFLMTNKRGLINFETSKELLKTAINILIIFLFIIEINDALFTTDDIAHIGHIIGFLFGIFYSLKKMLSQR